jgi:molybdopterin converting factor small subunit
VTVNVELGSWFKKYYNDENVLKLELRDGANLSDLISALDKIDPEEIGFIAVNNEKKKDNFVISSKDDIKIFPLIIGG